MDKNILDSKIEKTQIELFDIDKIIPYTNNPRKNQNIDKIASSILEFGFQQPIVIDKNNVIIVGHSRFEASKKIGLKKVPVLKTDLSDVQAKAYRIADNKLNEFSQWDNDLLNIELTQLGDLEFDKNILGFSENDLTNILSEIEPVFRPANNQIMDYDIGDIKAPASQVRMIQLFLDSSTEPKFKTMIEKLKNKYQITNLTDIVYKAVENESNNS